MRMNLYRSTTALLLLSLITVMSSCFNRFSCDQSDDKNLGRISFSQEFTTWNIEANVDTLVFESASDKMVMVVQENSREKYHRLREYDICEEIDIKPYTAYAYYEYPNMNRFYSSNKGILVLEPSMENIEGTRTESLFITASLSDFYSVKARVPISHVEKIKPESPNGRLFTYHESISLGDRTYSRVWHYTKTADPYSTSLIYSKEKGVLAIQVNDTVYHRVGAKCLRVCLVSSF